MKPRIIFFGTPEFAVPTLKAIHRAGCYDIATVVTQPDRRQGRGKKLHSPPVKLVAEELGIPVLQPENIRKELSNFMTQLQDIGTIDCGIVVAFGQILPTDVLEYPRVGCLNIHASLLPRWRGAAPMQRAIMEGDSHTGVCIMQMEAGLDTGPVFALKDVEIKSDTTLATLHDQLSEVGAELLLTVLPDILSNSINADPQAEDGIIYASKIKNDETKIDWNLKADEIERLIRGLNPFPGAHTLIRGKRLKIYNAKVVNQSPSNNSGSIAFLDKNTLHINCSDSQLKLVEVQLEGKKKMAVADFIRGFDLSEQDNFSID